MLKDTEHTGRVVVISGPTGSGKNSIIDGIVEKCDNCARLVTATTRVPREGEKHAEDYYFLSKEEFLKEMKEGLIPEHWYAPETDRYYGIYLPDLEKKLAEGKLVLTHVQIEGLRFLKENYDALSFFVAPDSMEELKRRVLTREDMSDEELTERLREAKREVDEYSREYDHTIVNERGKLDEAIESVMDILRKEQYL